MSNFCRQKDYSRKNTGTREVKPRILIVCEGTKTEPNYFEAFKISTLDVQVEGTGMNTDSLVREAIRFKTEAGMRGDPFDYIWAVFDRDSFLAQNFNNALQLAEKNNIKVAYSNEAFEIWYMLHFNYYNTGMARSQYPKILTEQLGRQYEKNEVGMYEELKEKQPTAIRNGKKLMEVYGTNHNPHRDNPCTKVFELVEFLNLHI